MRFRSLTIAAAATALLVAPATALADTGSSGAQVTVVHGIPDLPVDVWANGDPLLEDFQPGTVTDPVSLPAGSYDLEIYPAGSDPESTDPALSATADVTDGLNASIVAHLTEGGDPTLTIFPNDTSALDAGQARVTVRHTAAAPAVDILAGGDALIEGLSNPNGESADVPAGSYDIAVNAAGSDTEVTAVPGFELAEGTSTIVYAIGDLEGGSFDLLVQTISGLHSAPEGVPAGSAGLADDQGALALTAAGLLVLAGLAVAVRRRASVEG